MARIHPVEQETADAETREILGVVRKKMGLVPNFIATMANSSAVLKAYLGFSRSLSTGSLCPRLREQIALVVSEANGSCYCVAAHTVLSQGTGLSKQETIDARRCLPTDMRERAALEFARDVVQSRGQITDQKVAQLIDAGFSEGEISEIIANIALNLFTNYINLVAATDLDFPAAPNL